MPISEEKPKMTKADHASKLANWIRHECKTNHPKLEATIVEMLPKDGVKLEGWIKKNLGTDHPQIKLAIDNTIKAIG